MCQLDWVYLVIRVCKGMYFFFLLWFDRCFVSGFYLAGCETVFCDVLIYNMYIIGNVPSRYLYIYVGTYIASEIGFWW